MVDVTTKLGLLQIRGSFTAGYLPATLADREPFVNLADGFILFGQAGVGVPDLPKRYFASAPGSGGGGGPANTDGLPEGTNNRYYTDARARAAFSAGGGLTYTAATGVFSYTLPAPTTTTLGGVKAGTAAGGSFVTGIDGTGALTFGTPTGGGSGPASTDALPEGTTNLYFTQGRARNAISATGSIAYNATTGVISYTAPALAAVATSGSASDLTTGTLPAGRLPTPTATTLGGVKALAAVTSQWIRGIGADGTPTASQPAFSDISGTVSTVQIADKAVSNPKLADMPASTLKGATAAGSPADLTVAQVKTLLAYAIADVSGLQGALDAKLAVAAKATGALLRALADDANYLTSKAMADAIGFVSLGNLTGTVAVNFASGFQQTGVLVGNITLGQPTGGVDGEPFVLEAKQDSTGSRTIAVNTTYWKVPASISLTLSTAASARDKIFGTVRVSGGVTTVDVEGFIKGLPA